VTGIFDKLFGKKSKPDDILDQSDQVTTPRGDYAGTKISPDEYPTYDLPQLTVGCGHSTGRQRDHNEDAIFTLTTNIVTGMAMVPFGLYIIADGMGGHQQGEVASAVSVRALASYVLNKLFIPWLTHSSVGNQYSLHEVMQDGVSDAHRMIIKDAPGSGTTLTAALILGNQIIITHVGDSRAYLIDADRNMRVLTHDHSLVKRLEELGQISPEEAANHPQRNVLYRALGQGDPFEPDVDSYQLPKSGYLLICSDGLWGVITQEKILEIVFSAKDPQEACQNLVDSANNAGGPDNISAILVRLPSVKEG
jgi:serine/threonine protein phosphatase PrpC